MDSKFCPQCRKDLPLNAFKYNIKKKTYSHYCFTCTKKHSSNVRRKEKECPMYREKI